MPAVLVCVEEGSELWIGGRLSKIMLGGSYSGTLRAFRSRAGGRIITDTDVL